ncbi:hypothetical protein [Streptomyces sp. NPDC058731]|jgi:hypothetical protein|uniref:hypothetical protein n=1 Tax=Streptomyces sp. NPDC058731 TaxID=3346613 RepID=UPI00367EC759
MIATAVLLQLLIVAGALYDTACLLAPDGTRRAPRRRLRYHRAALERAERRLVDQRLHGRIDEAAYRARMRSLADGRRQSWRGRHR